MGMLVLSRQAEETVVLVLPDKRRVTLTVVELYRCAARCRIGFVAPPDVKIYRGEIMDEIDRAARERAAQEASQAGGGLAAGEPPEAADAKRAG